MKIQFIKSPEKKKILEKLNQQYGITSLPYLLLRFGHEKIRGYSGSLSKEELMKLNRELRIELMGLYLMKQEEQMRLSFDSTNILDIKKNIINITDQQTDDWLKGQDITTEEDLKGFVVLKNRNNFLGCGKASRGRVTNFVPKDRRIKG